jgi:hypothetical protein
MKREARRVYREQTPEEQLRLQGLREQVAQELPDLIQRDQLRKNAAEEETLSGALRRAIHKGDVPITEIARRCEIGFVELDEFLTGERTLPSSVIDRLVEILGCKLVSA